MAENACTAMELVAVPSVIRLFAFWPGFLPDIIEGVAQMKSLWSALLLVVGLTVLPAPAAFAAGILKFEPKAGTTMKEALAALKGERVMLTLDSGEKIEGKVTMIGDSVVYITQLTDMVFYDAVVSLDKINAVVFRKEF